MRKTLLFAAALCLSASAMAQTFEKPQSVSELADTQEGTPDKPFVLKEGGNTVPAEAGEYYYSYTLSKTGYLNINSDEKLEDGKVSVYTNIFSAQNKRNAAAESATGSFNVRTEIKIARGTYYIVVNKKTATAKAETFNVKMEDYQPGETAGTAIPVNVSDVATTVTLPKAKGTIYYSIMVPANTDKFLVVESTTTLSEESSAYVNIGTSEWGAAYMKNNIIRKDVKNTADQTYLLIVNSNEEYPLCFKISYADIEKGAVATNPKEAQPGQNTIDFDGTEYYTYKATKSGKLAIEVSDGGKVTFPLSATGYGVNDTYQKGNTYFIEATRVKNT